MTTFPDTPRTFPGANLGTKHSQIDVPSPRRGELLSGNVRKQSTSPAMLPDERPAQAGPTAGPSLSGKDRSAAWDSGAWHPCGQPTKNGTPCRSFVRTDLGYATCWSHGEGRGRTSTPRRETAS
jgi:hypothetical protein